MIYHFILYIAVSLVRLLEFLFFARAIMSWFAQSGSSSIYEFLYTITEPIVLPFRQLTNRVEVLRQCPFDIAFLLAFFALELLLQLLHSI